MNEQRIGAALLLGSSSLTGLLCVALLWGYWPPRPAQPDPLEQVRHLQLGASGPACSLRLPEPPIAPSGLLQGDLAAMRRYVHLPLARLRASGFEWLGQVRPGSWRAGPGRDERAQSFAAYKLAESYSRLPRRRVLVIRAVGPWPERAQHLFGPITRFLTAYFQRPVRWERPLPLPARSRLTADGAAIHHQYPVDPILMRLRDEAPSDALAVVGLTFRDIYPHPSWRYVFGMADLTSHVAVVSTSRLSPRFWGDAVTPHGRLQWLRRLLTVIAHEVGHALGLAHCVTFRCVQNGSNGLDDLDDTPAHLCPLDLAKLAWRLDWRVAQRHRDLAALFYSLGFLPDARWHAHRARLLLRSQPSPASH